MERLQRTNKASAKQVRTQLRELAQLIAFRHLNSDPRDTVACIHRDDGDVEFMNILANQLSPQVGVRCKWSCVSENSPFRAYS